VRFIARRRTTKTVEAKKRSQLLFYMLDTPSMEHSVYERQSVDGWRFD